MQERLISLRGAAAAVASLLVPALPVEVYIKHIILII